MIMCHIVLARARGEVRELEECDGACCVEIEDVHNEKAFRGKNE